ncbi:RRQRL motif-containing zinc-binding protein [Nocardia puris]|uniref:RRQRL motif-containing zinc-binding protein n=1 Tax=Nocardia puris TaxID=208602 RepID=UPI002E2191C5
MSRFLDPEGTRFGLPTWPWRMAPAHLRTRNQLAEKGLRPGGEYEAQVLRARGGSRGPMRAYLYDSESAVPKREPSPAQLEALRIARWTRSAEATERRGIDATDMRELIEQARRDLAARRAQRDRPTQERQGRERSR